MRSGIVEFGFFSLVGTRSGIVCYILLPVESALVFSVIFSCVWNVLCFFLLNFPAWRTHYDILCCNFRMWNVLWYLVSYFPACGTCSAIFWYIFPCVKLALVFFVIFSSVWNASVFCVIYVSMFGTHSGILCYIFLLVERALVLFAIYLPGFLFIFCCIILTLLSVNCSFLIVWNYL